jgi:superfamily II DNA/RNA helicase
LSAPTSDSRPDWSPERPARRPHHGQRPRPQGTDTTRRSPNPPRNHRAPVRPAATHTTVADHVETTVPDGPIPSFAELGLPEALVTALHRHGIEAPFPIQAATMPDALAGRDVLGRGQTGSGKTLGFGLPLLTRLAGGTTAPKRPRGLVLVPTRELAMQVHDALEPYAHALGMEVRVVVGGTSFGKQVEGLRRGADLVVATPGRLTDLIQQRACDLGDVEITALDEADHMADMGFLPQVRKLLDQVKPGGQRLLFSATLDKDVDTLVRLYLTDPVTHSIAPPSASVTTMEHHILHVTNDDKTGVVAAIGAREGRTIMFVRTKHGADRLAKQLRAVGVSAGSLHGGKAQNARTRTLDRFRDGTVPVLVATDVAARGIHVDDVSLVVHVDPPADSKDYLHRAGRTARAGDSGTVVTLVLPAQRREVDQMTRRAGIDAAGARVRPEDAALVELTGAATPSGTPVADLTAGGPSQPQGSRRRQRPEGAPRTPRSTGGAPRATSGTPRTHSAASVSQGGGRRRGR